MPVVLAVLLALLVGVAVWRPWATDEAPPGTARTILLVTPDTLRRDRVGVYGRNARTRGPLTPRMDALAAEGLRFDDARTPVPLTLPAHATMLAGLPPAATGVRLNAYGRLPDAATRGYPLLAERLREAGWRTAAFVSAAPLLALHGLDQGFDHYDDAGLDDAPPALAYAERAGEDTVDRALAWIAAEGQGARLFVWVHLFEPHAPYAPELPPTTPTEVRYDADVARADRVVGRLLDGLTAAGRGDAAVLLAADHGEALEELGERTHGYLLGDAVLRVPFLLRAPGVRPGVRDDPVDLADVAPTLAGLAGVPWTAADTALPGTGRDLLAGPLPPTRTRVAEALFGHQRYGWAQLVGAVGRDGMLVDAGGDRVLWLAPAPFLEPQASPRPAGGRPEAAALATTLRAYRAGERRDLLRGGDVAGGYGSGARVAPFLDPQENGRLRNPYDAIPQVAAIDGIAEALLTGADPRAVIRQLTRMEVQDSANPELAWWRGRAWERRARTDPAATTAAAEAYLEAWRRGRKDANTLGRLVGVDALDRESDALELLRRLAGEIPSDARIALQEARLLRALGRDAEADAACERAERLCRRPWERAALERARTDGTCR
jgi:hypothetical protein